MWLPPAWLFPVDRSASLTLRVVIAALLASVLLYAAGRGRRAPRIGALLLAAGTLVVWGGLYLARPPWQRVALAESTNGVVLDAPPLRRVGPGVEVGEWTLSLDHATLEEVALVRLDPARYVFVVRTDVEAPHTIDAWREQLGAVAIVNGSYYLPDHTPQTPLRAGGVALGPCRYESTHGAFVADPAHGSVAIVDLRDVALPRGLSPFPEAMVSYPMLIAPDGSSRAEGSHDWLASRTFVGIDGDGKVVLGTTRRGYFSLRRLAAFLHDAPLGLRIALNLDGGPIASQAVAVDDYRRTVIGSAETNDGTDVLRARMQLARRDEVPLPIVLAALPRSRAP